MKTDLTSSLSDRGLPGLRLRTAQGLHRKGCRITSYPACSVESSFIFPGIAKSSPVRWAKARRAGGRGRVLSPGFLCKRGDFGGGGPARVLLKASGDRGRPGGSCKCRSDVTKGESDHERYAEENCH